MQEKQDLVTITNLLDYVYTKYPEISNDETSCVFIDEIQESVEIYRKLRFYNREFKTRIVISGSYLKKLIQNEQFSPPAGDLWFIRLSTLSFTEFKAAFNKFNKNYPTEELFNLYLQLGGYPEIVKTYILTETVDDNIILSLVDTIFQESSTYLKEVGIQLSLPTMIEVMFTNFLKEKCGLQTKNLNFRLRENLDS